MSRSAIAFTMSLDALVEGHRYCRLWTFTLPGKDAILPRQAGRMWGNLQRRLVREVGFFGVRAYELHPGGHGLHVHAVAAKYFDVNHVRSIAKACGFGRVHVCCIPCDKARYIGKYLSKQQRYPELKGMRLFARVGASKFRGVPTKNIECISAQGKIFRKFFEALSYQQRERLYHYVRRLSVLAACVDCGIFVVDIKRCPCGDASYRVRDCRGIERLDWSIV